MNEVIIWAEFLGAWLLVAGPLYQGSIELSELDFDRDGIEGIKAAAVQAGQDRPSPWWWLLPPVMYLLYRRRTKAFRKATVALLTETQRKQFASFRNKATGWFTVAGGATLLAAGETWQVTERNHWPVWMFWLLLVVMAIAALFNTAIQMHGDENNPRPARDASARRRARHPAADDA